MGKVIFIQTPNTSNYSVDEESGFLNKKALILAEGTWKDSKKRTHNFSPERLSEIADNTNSLFSKGSRIPILKDHKQTMDNTIGDLESNVEIREITEEDVPEEKFQNLIGKLGLFAENICIKAQDAIDQASQGLLSTISPGIDILDNVIREISVTPTPAIPGMRLFHQGQNTYADFALTWDEMEKEVNDFTEIRENLKELNNKFVDLTENIISASEEELSGFSHEKLVLQAIQDYALRIAANLGIDEQSMNQQDGHNSTLAQPQKQAQTQANSIMSAKHGKGYPYSGFSKEQPRYVAAFSMADMAEFKGWKGLDNLIESFKNIKKTAKQRMNADIDKLKEVTDSTIRKGSSAAGQSATEGAIQALRIGLEKEGKEIAKKAIPVIGTGILGTGAVLGGGTYLGTRKALSDDRKNKAQKRKQLLNKLTGGKK